MAITAKMAVVSSLVGVSNSAKVLEFSPEFNPDACLPGASLVRQNSVSESSLSLDFRSIYPNRHRLLDVCDDVRASLCESRTFGRRRAEISEFIRTMVRREAGESLPLDFGTVRYARIDKLLADILDPAHRSAVMMLPHHRTNLACANDLQRKWRARFRDDYFALDQMRYSALITSLLRDVVFNPCPPQDSLELWRLKSESPTPELGSNTRFEPGQWWLNLACAQRDGIVGSEVENPTLGQYGITSVSLITGHEECLGGSMVKYMREGQMSDMHIDLIPLVGKKVRVLRGYRLMSVLAPRAGVRYDGLYTIRAYGTVFDQASQLYRLELTLECVSDQRSLDRLRDVPRPSQLDDWALYQKLEGEMIKHHRGDRGLMEWKMERAEEKLDREQWRRVREFTASLERK